MVSITDVLTLSNIQVHHTIPGLPLSPHSSPDLPNKNCIFCPQQLTSPASSLNNYLFTHITSYSAVVYYMLAMQDNRLNMAQICVHMSGALCLYSSLGNEIYVQVIDWVMVFMGSIKKLRSLRKLP